MAVLHGSEIEGVGAASSAGGWDRVIIGIDPGTNVMGYGILGVNGKKPAMIAMGVIKLSRFDDHYMRLRHIHQRVAAFTNPASEFLHRLPKRRIVALVCPQINRNIHAKESPFAYFCYRV